MKKKNALLGLISIVLLIAHAAYQLFSYITFYYNPKVSGIIGSLLLLVVIAHVVISIRIVLGKNESKTIVYKKKNIRTIIQRVSALIMLFLMPVHVLQFLILKNSANALASIMIMFTLVLFFAALMTHISCSFSNMLISLGLLDDIKKKKVIDRFVLIICLAVFVLVTFVTVSVQIKLYFG